MFVTFPQGFIAFNFSYLTWKPICWLCTRYIEKLLYPNLIFFLPFFFSPPRENLPLYMYSLMQYRETTQEGRFQKGLITGNFIIRVTV